MQLPICLKSLDEELPELASGQSRYVLAENGLFLERAGEMYTTSTRARISELPVRGHHEYCRLSCGKIPRVMHRAMLSFFRYAHEVHGGEAALVLLYHPLRRVFRWYCPEQTVEVTRSRGQWMAGDSVRFNNPLALPEGYVHFGDAHSHPFGPSSPSVTDLADDQDGLHIIVADLHRAPSYNVDFVMDGARFRFTPEMVFEDFQAEPFPCPPKSWLTRVYLKRREAFWAGWGGVCHN